MMATTKIVTNQNLKEKEMSIVALYREYSYEVEILLTLEIRKLRLRSKRLITEGRIHTKVF